MRNWCFAEAEPDGGAALGGPAAGEAASHRKRRWLQSAILLRRPHLIFLQDTNMLLALMEQLGMIPHRELYRPRLIALVGLV